ncbi:MAG TPA: sterol desaturase family protein, partial [Acidobacteriota bacterium]|nr:sterol desaturase family protein [Acidobacteriota bacterium]
IGTVMQRPEHHSIHHELGVHRYNYSDLTIWDRMFGTFCEAQDFAGECGFAQMRETRVGEMLAFHSVNPD